MVLSSEEGLLKRVQQANQRQIVGKLLHDLRNPVHSIRITVELFARLVRKPDNMEVLLERAGRYMEPAEAAVNALVASCERLTDYLAPVGAPKPAAVALNEWLSQLATLLRGTSAELHVDWVASDADADVHFSADRARLSHSALRFCLSNAASQVALSAQVLEQEVRIDIALDVAAATSRRDEEMQFTADDLRSLIETAGGRVGVPAPGAVSLSFSRSQ